MADFKIEAQPRQITGKQTKQLRKDGLVPAVVYGPGIEPFPIQVPYRPLEVTLMKAGGTNLIDIAVEGKQPDALQILGLDGQIEVGRAVTLVDEAGGQVLEIDGLGQ